MVRVIQVFIVKVLVRVVQVVLQVIKVVKVVRVVGAFQISRVIQVSDNGRQRSDLGPIKTIILKSLPFILSFPPLPHWHKLRQDVRSHHISL